MPFHFNDVPQFWIDFDFFMDDVEVAEVMWLYVQKYEACNPGVLEMH